MTPDIIITRGRLLTMDDTNPVAEALAVVGNRIARVGASTEIEALAGPETRVIDAVGGTVLPGLIDSHVHLFGGSVELDYLDLYGVSGLDALAGKIEPYARAVPGSECVFCVQADYGCADGRNLTRHDLDRIVPDRPLAMFAPDHHTVWANSEALRQAGILDGGDAGRGSEIVMGADGKATGELLEPGAYTPVLYLTRYRGRDMLGLSTGRDPDPAPTAAERERDKDAIARGLRHCARQGITGLHNMDGNRYQLELLAELEAEGRLLCRVEVPFHFKGFDDIDRLDKAEAMRRDFQGAKVWCNRVKLFIDGVVESGTALMLRPYPGQPENRGEAVFERAHFDAAIAEADKRGFQVAVHAIGDAGVRWTLDAYEKAHAANGRRDARHRIEHLEVMHPDDIPRLAALDIVASIQPGHAPRGRIFPADGIGPWLHDEQKPTAFAWQTIRETGARVIFSTDWPVIGVEVMRNIRAAIAPLDLGAPWTDQTQSLRDTLESYTRGNAWVEFGEADKGMLKAGMLADIAVFDRDLEALAPERITDAAATVTIMDGRVTFEAL